MAATASSHPVPIHAVIPQTPTCVVATDASQHDMGGFCLTATKNILCHVPFPPSIQQSLITQANPTGTVTNGNLELVDITLGSTVAA
jgi:hypothetical protein